MKYFGRFLLLTGAFALTTIGLMGWHDLGFTLGGLWPFTAEVAIHPLYLLILGLAMIPPALWEIFLLERAQTDAPGAAAISLARRHD